MPDTVAKQVVPLLSVRKLRTHFTTRAGTVRAVDGVDLELSRGEILGLVGESGSGKSNVLLSILNLVPKPAGRIVSGEVLLDGRDLLRLRESEMRKVRGQDLAMILQDPTSALNPVLTVGTQVGEAITAHLPVGRRALKTRVVEALRRVQIPSPAARARDHPHQFSGGMRQRVMTAIAMSCEPRILLADEPTTALDVTTQSQFLALMRELRSAGIGILYVTHDLGVVAELCDRVAVMYAGRIVETGPVKQIFVSPRHPYTAGLIRSVPRLGRPHQQLYQIDGLPPDPLHLPTGCPFAPRCPSKSEQCEQEDPPTLAVDVSSSYRCWHPIAKDQPRPTPAAHMERAG